MSWHYRIAERAIKQLRKPGTHARQRVITFLDERIQGCDDPRFGKALRGDLGEFWRHRVGHSRILCHSSLPHLFTSKYFHSQ